MESLSDLQALHERNEYQIGGGALPSYQPRLTLECSFKYINHANAFVNETTSGLRVWLNHCKIPGCADVWALKCILEVKIFKKIKMLLQVGRWEGDQISFVVGVQNVLNDCTRLVLLDLVKSSRRTYGFRMQGTSSKHTSQRVTLVFGSSRTGVNPFGFNLVLNADVFWSSVRQILVS